MIDIQSSVFSYELWLSWTSLLLLIVQLYIKIILYIIILLLNKSQTHTHTQVERNYYYAKESVKYICTSNHYHKNSMRNLNKSVIIGILSNFECF